MPKQKNKNEKSRSYSRRPIWSGSLSFGLINIPVYVYSGSRDRALHFHLLHKEDYSPIGYKKVCEAEDKEVPDNEIVKGYEIEKNQYVILRKEDFEKADARKVSTIEISNFTSEENIDAIYYEKPYFVEADTKAEKAYVLLREALKKAGKVGIATFVIRGRENLGIVRPWGNKLVLNQLRYDNEIRNPEGLNFPQKEDVKTVSEEEMEIALLLINKLSKDFDIKKYTDTYSEALLDVIEERRQGRTPKRRGEVPEETPMTDLMGMLKKSLAEHQGAQK